MEWLAIIKLILDCFANRRSRSDVESDGLNPRVARAVIRRQLRRSGHTRDEIRSAVAEYNAMSAEDIKAFIDDAAEADEE